MSRSKESKKRQAKSIIAGVIAFLIISAMIVGLITPFVNGAELDGSQIDCQIQFGFDNQYKVNLSTPVYAYATNSGDDFKGSLQVKVRVTQEDQEPTYDIYEFPLDLPRGSSKVIDASMVYPTIIKDFQASIVDEKGVFVKSVTQSVQALHMTQVLVGVLGDSPNNLYYLKNMQIGGSLDGVVDRTAISDKLIFLGETNFPSSIRQLLNFNLIIINDYDTGKLTNDQISALEQYVMTGGQLVLSDGVNKGKVLDKLDFINYNGDFLPIYMDFQSGLKSIGSGKVLLHDFDMSLASFTENASPSASEFLTQMYNANLEILKNENYFYNYNGIDLSYISERIPMESPSIIYVILLIVFTYALFTGVVIFPILKRLDKSNLGFIFIPTGTVIVTAIVFALSFGTVYKKPIINSISQTYLEQGVSNGKRKTDSVILSPKSGNMTVEIGDMEMDEVFDGSSNGSYYYYPSTKYKDNIRTKYIYGSDKKITYYQTSAWERRRIGYNKDIDLGGALTTDISLSGNRLVGSISNGTDRDFTDIIVGIDYDVQKYDHLKAGETLSIDQELDASILSGMGSGYIYDKIDQIFSYNNFSERVKRDVLMQGIYNNYSGYGTTYYSSSMYAQKAVNTRIMPSSPSTSADWSVQIVMFDTYTSPNSGFKVDGIKPTFFDLNVYRMTVPLNIDVSGEYELFHGLLKISNLESDNFHIYTGGDGSLNLTPKDQHISSGYIYAGFDLSPLKNIKGFEIAFNNDMQQHVTKEIFNEATEDWETIDDTAYISANTNDYIGSNGILNLRIGVSSDIYYIYTPTIMVKGGE